MFTAFVKYDDDTVQFAVASTSLTTIREMIQKRAKDDYHITFYWIQNEAKKTIRAGFYSAAGYIVEWAVE